MYRSIYWGRLRDWSVSQKSRSSSCFIIRLQALPTSINWRASRCLSWALTASGWGIRDHICSLCYIFFFAYCLTFPVCKCLCYVHFRLLRIWILLLPWTVCSLARIKSIGCRTLMDCTVWRFSASRCVCARTFFSSQICLRCLLTSVPVWQSNRITKLEGLQNLVNLRELYLSHNGIEVIEGLENNVRSSTVAHRCNTTSCQF